MGYEDKEQELAGTPPDYTVVYPLTLTSGHPTQHDVSITTVLRGTVQGFSFFSSES
ncbi:hypothetical protein Pmani_003407, partial [Petrolisthes manimaculis]